MSETTGFASTSEAALSLAASFHGSMVGTQLETQVGASWSPEMSFLSRETMTESLEHSDKFELMVAPGKYIQVKQPIISFANPSSDESLYVTPRFYITHEDEIGKTEVCQLKKDRMFQEGAIYTIKNRQFGQHYLQYDPTIGHTDSRHRLGAGRTPLSLPDSAYWKFDFAKEENGERYWYIVTENVLDNARHRLNSEWDKHSVHTVRTHETVSEKQMYRMKHVNPDAPSDQPKYFQIINKANNRAVMKYWDDEWNLFDVTLEEADERSHWHVESILGNSNFDWDEFYSYDNLADEETTVSVRVSETIFFEPQLWVPRTVWTPLLQLKLNMA